MAVLGLSSEGKKRRGQTLWKRLHLRIQGREKGKEERDYITGWPEGMNKLVFGGCPAGKES